MYIAFDVKLSNQNTETNMSKREEIIKTLSDYGHNVEMLKRTQLFKLEEMIEKHVQKEKDEHETIQNDMKDSVSNKSIRKLERQPILEQKYDDSCTVVDLSSKRNASNYVDELYGKFKESIKSRNTLMHSITTNSNMLNEYVHKLDEDVTFVITQEINKCKEMLQLVLNEMGDIRTHLCRIKLEKKAFYEQYKTNLVDLSGNLYKFFDNKLENINRYMEEIELMDQDYKSCQ